MSVYVIAQLRFKDRATYDRYQARFLDVFSKFEGRLLAADERPKVLEGQWDREKVVMLQFPDESASRQFLESREYQEIAIDRKKGADTLSLLVRGFGQT